MDKLLEMPVVPSNRFIGRMMAFQRDPLRLFVEVAAEHGDISQMKVMGLRVVTLRSAEGVKHVLVQNSRNYSVAINTRMMLGYWLGDGLFVSEGDRWLQSRRLMQPMFHRSSIEHYGTLIAAAASDFCDRWQLDVGQTVDLFEQMQQLTLYIAAKAFLGVDIRAQGDAEAFGIAISEMVDFYGRWIRNSFLALVPHRYMQRVPRFKRALQTADRIVERLIAERRKAPRTHRDILDLLLDARDEETGAILDDRGVRDEVMTLLSAGHETTASALSWTFYLLSQHPAAQRRLTNELATVLGGRKPTVADVPQLTYTTKVIQESLRLYPPAWGIFRLALEEDDLLGYAVRPGDRIGVSPYVIHRNPAYWPDPERFDPERFDAQAIVERPKFAYIPFGGGPRQCLGKHFAMLEMQIAVATIAQRFLWESLPEYPVAPEALITLRPRHGMKMTLRQANSATLLTE